MPGILLSGPAGSGKSQAAREILRESTEPAVAADFQSIVAALLLQERLPNGKYPPRPDWILPLAEYVRLAVIQVATARGLNVVATNSDGGPARRASLLDRLKDQRLPDSPNAVERIIDPGFDVVRARLADESGELSDPCSSAISRWYSRLNRG